MNIVRCPKVGHPKMKTGERCLSGSPSAPKWVTQGKNYEKIGKIDEKHGKIDGEKS